MRQEQTRQKCLVGATRKPSYHKYQNDSVQYKPPCVLLGMASACWCQGPRRPGSPSDNGRPLPCSASSQFFLSPSERLPGLENFSQGFALSPSPWTPTSAHTAMSQARISLNCSPHAGLMGRGVKSGKSKLLLLLHQEGGPAEIPNYIKCARQGL